MRAAYQGRIFLGMILWGLVMGTQASAEPPPKDLNSQSLVIAPGKHDNTQPIEIFSDMLSVQNETNHAVFEGNVRARQGNLRLQSDRLEVLYKKQAEISKISKIHAEGHVFITQDDQTAEAQQADYDLDSNTLYMRGNVVLIRGKNVLSGQFLVMDLSRNQGSLEAGPKGRVKAVFSSKSP